MGFVESVVSNSRPHGFWLLREVSTALIPGIILTFEISVLFVLVLDREVLARLADIGHLASGASLWSSLWIAMVVLGLSWILGYVAREQSMWALAKVLEPDLDTHERQISEGTAHTGPGNSSSVNDKRTSFAMVPANTASIDAGQKVRQGLSTAFKDESAEGSRVPEDTNEPAKTASIDAGQKVRQGLSTASRDESAEGSRVPEDTNKPAKDDMKDRFATWVVRGGRRILPGSLDIRPQTTLAELVGDLALMYSVEEVVKFLTAYPVLGRMALADLEATEAVAKRGGGGHVLDRGSHAFGFAKNWLTVSAPTLSISSMELEINLLAASVFPMLLLWIDGFIWRGWVFATVSFLLLHLTLLTISKSFGRMRRGERKAALINMFDAWMILKLGTQLAGAGQSKAVVPDSSE